MLTKSEFLNKLRDLKDKNKLIILDWGPKFYIREVIVRTYTIDLIITPHKVEAMNIRNLAIKLLKFGSYNCRMYIYSSNHFIIGAVRDINKRLYSIYVC